MATKTPKTSTAADVRTWATANKIEVAGRGRIAAATVAAFNKANPRKKYAAA